MYLEMDPGFVLEASRGNNDTHILVNCGFKRSTGCFYLHVFSFWTRYHDNFQTLKIVDLNNNKLSVLSMVKKAILYFVKYFKILLS